MTPRSDGPATPFLGTISLANEGATADLGRSLSEIIADGDVLLLSGDLGAGKTALARGLIRSLTAPDTEVPSPTFTLVQDYDTRIGPVHHFDLYRIESEDEIPELGFEDALADGVCLIEWPDRLGAWLPPGALRIELAIAGEEGRLATIGASSGNWRQRLASHLLWDTLTTQTDERD
ncbi:MAG: tRNA (adenosine(37)-N6)-threonylcarbamoyltransferase complex ATPase subunit type 1 TsaE [Rhodospirillales bacterium]